MIQNAVELFQDYEPKHLETIKVVLFKDKLLPDFQEMITKVAPSKAIASVSSRFATSIASSSKRSSSSSSAISSSSYSERLSKESTERKPKKNAMMLTLCAADEKIIHEVRIRLWFVANFSCEKSEFDLA